MLEQLDTTIERLPKILATDPGLQTDPKFVAMRDAGDQLAGRLVRIRRPSADRRPGDRLPGDRALAWEVPSPCAKSLTPSSASVRSSTTTWPASTTSCRPRTTRTPGCSGSSTRPASARTRPSAAIIRLDVQKTKSSIYVRVGRRRDARGAVNPSAEPTIFIGAPFVKEPVGSKPTLTPMEARLRNLTYQAPIFLKVTVVENGVERAPEDVHIGDLPIMVKSRPCNLNRYKVSEDDQTLALRRRVPCEARRVPARTRSTRAGTPSSAARNGSSSPSRTSRPTGSSPSTTSGTAPRSRARRCSASAAATGRSPSSRRRRTACSRSRSRRRADRSRS